MRKGKDFLTNVDFEGTQGTKGKDCAFFVHLLTRMCDNWREERAFLGQFVGIRCKAYETVQLRTCYAVQATLLAAYMRWINE